MNRNTAAGQTAASTVESALFWTAYWVFGFTALFLYTQALPELGHDGRWWLVGLLAFVPLLLFPGVRLFIDGGAESSVPIEQSALQGVGALIIGLGGLFAVAVLEPGTVVGPTEVTLIGTYVLAGGLMAVAGRPTVSTAQCRKLVAVSFASLGPGLVATVAMGASVGAGHGALLMIGLWALMGLFGLYVAGRILLGTTRYPIRCTADRHDPPKSQLHEP